MSGSDELLPPAGLAGEAWVERRLGRIRPGQRLLVLCRTKATVSLVRRTAARRGGWLGVEAATPSGLAQQVRLRPLLAGAPARREDVALPPDSAIGARIGDRPGLTAIARRWAQRARKARAVGDPIEAPAWLEELLEGDFGLDEDLAALLELCAAAAERGKALHAGATWDRVVALGFDEEPAALEPTDRHLAHALAGHVPSPVEPLPGPLETWEVPDVGAEAALAAASAAADPEGTLILVADEATARRVRDALDRNGVPCAWRDAEPLGAHPVAGAVRRAAAWFAEGADPAIQSGDLELVLARTSLGRALHPAVEAFLARRLEAFPEPLRGRLGRRRLVEVVDAARLLDAPLSRWIARMAEIDAGRFLARSDQQRERIRAASHHLLARLLVLSASTRGIPLEEALGEADPRPLAFDPDDFEEALRELLGDEVPEPALPAAGTLGALKRFLVACRLRVHDDPVARAILAALHRRASLPATLPMAHAILSGPGLDPGVLRDGVDVLLIDDWDGRPCRTLVVTDVHDHGLARRPAPDPLLDDAEIRALGALAGTDRVHHRLRTLRRAAGLADRAILLVTRRDASGREVVAPIQLDTRRGTPPAAGSYGLELSALPEVARARALAAVDGPPVPPEHEDPLVRALATQATLEWVRDGRGGTLAEVDHASWLLPWLGHADGVPEAALPDRAHSVSGLLQPLARCPWQAFAKEVLRIEEPPTVSAELDPRELGQAVHEALDRAGHEVGYCVGHLPPEDVDRVLRERTQEAFDDVLARFGALSTSREASARGLQGRWERHWRGWAASRARWPQLDWPGAMYHHPDVVEAEALFRRRVPAAARMSEWDVRGWILARASSEGASGFAPELLRSWGNKELPASAVPDLAALLDEPLLRAVGAARERARFNVETLTGRVGRVELRAAISELPFGGEERDRPAKLHGAGLDGLELKLPEAALRLGKADLKLRGRIDRVEWIGTDRALVFLVADWKTGTAEPDGRKFRVEQYLLRDPQLLVYAMVLERASREGQLPEVLRGGKTAAVAHDRVRHTFKDKEAGQPEPDRPDTWLPIEPRTLRGAALRLGAMVDEARAGRWALRPVPETCPRIAQFGGYCDVAASCRLRRLPPSEAEAEAEEAT